MRINVLLDDGVKMPTKAHEVDAGFDLYAPHDFTVRPNDSAVVDLGVHFEIPAGYCGFLKSKSGLNVKHGLVCEGVIDTGYTGSVVAKLYNHSDYEYKFEGGDKVTQIVFLPIPKVNLVLTDKFDVTERGDGGFGSTGK